MKQEAFDLIKKTQVKRNDGRQKLISIEKRIDEINNMESIKDNKQLRDELKKLT